MNEPSMIPGIMLLLGLGLFYFIPTIIAMARGHLNKLGIFLLNLFLGWTIIGWLIALIWSVSNQKETNITINQNVGDSK